jgi:hypothetical protein
MPISSAGGPYSRDAPSQAQLKRWCGCVTAHRPQLSRWRDLECLSWLAEMEPFAGCNCYYLLVSVLRHAGGSCTMHTQVSSSCRALHGGCKQLCSLKPGWDPAKVCCTCWRGVPPIKLNSQTATTTCLGVGRSCMVCPAGLGLGAGRQLVCL